MTDLSETDIERRIRRLEEREFGESPPQEEFEYPEEIVDGKEISPALVDAGSIVNEAAYGTHKTLTVMVGYSSVKFRRAAGLAFGYGLLMIALLAVLNVLRIVGLILLGSSPDSISVFLIMVNLGTALVVGTGGYVVLQRVRRTGAGYGVDLDWGRVLGP